MAFAMPTMGLLKHRPRIRRPGMAVGRADSLVMACSWLLGRWNVRKGKAEAGKGEGREGSRGDWDSSSSFARD